MAGCDVGAGFQDVVPPAAPRFADDGEAAFVVDAEGGVVVAPDVLGAVGEGGVERVGVVGADDAGGVG